MKIRKMCREIAKKSIAVVFAGLVAAVCFAAVAGAEKICSDNDPAIPSFGSGPVDVRLYASYFCGPCRVLEPEIEPVLKDLIENEQIRLIFIDVPIPQAVPYIRHFLYAVKQNPAMEDAFKIRHILFETAAKRGDEQEIRSSFEKREIPYTPYDVTKVFLKFNEYLKEDEVRSTPSIVICDGDSVDIYSGGKTILEALEALQAD